MKSSGKPDPVALWKLAEEIVFFLLFELLKDMW